MKSRGFMLIVVLCLCLILFALGTGFLSKKQLQYETAVHSVQSVQARALARAGLEDAYAKLCRDVRFPPPGGDDQTVFVYGETVSRGALSGAYTVEIDSSLHSSPWKILEVTSRGRVGSCTYVLRGELSLTPPWRWLQVQDLGTQ